MISESVCCYVHVNDTLKKCKRLCECKVVRVYEAVRVCMRLCLRVWGCLSVYEVGFACIGLFQHV